MANNFKTFIQNLLADNYDILPDVDINFNPHAESEEEILKSLNIAFLVLLAGEKHEHFKAAKKHINSVLTGDGGDSLFFGTNKHEKMVLYSKSMLPGFIRAFLRLLYYLYPTGIKGKNFLKKSSNNLLES